jgi:hypothetical protein
MRHGKAILALAALLGIGNAAHAALIYEARYQITESTGAPSEYGDIDVGDSAIMRFGWDISGAQQETESIWSGVVFDYSLWFGEVVIQSVSMSDYTYISREPYSAGLFFSDMVPYACPAGEPNCSLIPLLGGLFLDDLDLGFTCPGWVDRPALMSTLACESGLLGGFGLWGFYPSSSWSDYTQISGTLTSMRVVQVPEPATLGLFSLGLIGSAMMRRRSWRISLRNP